MRPDEERSPWAGGDQITLVSGLIDWTTDAIEALQVGDIERAQRDLSAIHHRLTSMVPDR